MWGPLMPATPHTVHVTDDDLEARSPLSQAEGLSQAELAEALDRIYWGRSVQQIPKPRYLMEDWIPAGSLVFLTGHGNSGKSLLALAWAQAVARGVEWSGKRVVRPGKVLYLTQEGVSSIPIRIEAAMKQRGFEDWTENLGLLPKTMSIGVRTDRDGSVQSGPDWPELVELVLEHRPVMIVIDPFADYFLPGQENSNDDAKAWINKARRILSELGEDAPTLVIPSHTSRTNEKGGEVRGASALYDGADRVYTITPLFPTEDDSAGYTSQSDLLGIKVSTLKSKDGGRPSVWYGEVFEHAVEGALGDKTVAVDGVSKERFMELEDIAKNRHKAVKRDDTEAQMRQLILEHVRREPGTNWTPVSQALSGKDAMKRAVRDALVEEGLLVPEGSAAYPIYFVADQEGPDEL